MIVNQGTKHKKYVSIQIIKKEVVWFVLTAKTFQSLNGIAFFPVQCPSFGIQNEYQNDCSRFL
jgi:hypothetical protein